MVPCEELSYSATGLTVSGGKIIIKAVFFFATKIFYNFPNTQKEQTKKSAPVKNLTTLF